MIISDSDSIDAALKELGISREYLREKVRENLIGYIYLIKCNEFYKIGMSYISPQGRLIEMQVGNPYKLEIIFSIKIEDAKKTEGILHKVYKARGYHERGEWYKIPEEHVALIVKELSENDKTKANQ